MHPRCLGTCADNGWQFVFQRWEVFEPWSVVVRFQKPKREGQYRRVVVRSIVYVVSLCQLAPRVP